MIIQKKPFITLLFCLVLISISLKSGAVDQTHQSLPKCSSPIDVTSAAGECVTIPEYYRLHVYEMGVCNGIDAFTKPTSPSNWDWKTKCFKTFDSGASPASILVKDNVSEPATGGTVIKPPNGTYTHGYVLIKAVIEIKGKVTLTDGGADSFAGAVPSGPGFGSSSGTGSICWTNGNGDYAWASDPKTNCGNSVDSSTYQESTVYFRNIHGAGDCTYINNNQFDAHCNFYGSGDIEEGLDPTSAFLIDSAGNLSTTPVFGTGLYQVDKMLGIATYLNPVVVTDKTSVMDVQFKVSRGLYVNYSNPSQINIGLREWKTTIRME